MDQKTQAYCSLWIAVLNQQISDATYGVNMSTEDKRVPERQIRNLLRIVPSTGKEKFYSRRYRAMAAREYILNSPGCTDVCNILGLERDFVVRLMWQMILRLPKELR